MTREEVYALCKSTASKYAVDPILILAICEQESSYNPFAVRLETHFFSKYIEKMSLATTSEVLLSCSFGLMQLMGESLRESGYFGWWKSLTDSPLEAVSQVGVVKALDWFMLHPEAQVDFGCRWYVKKRGLAGGDPKKALLIWNGGGDQDYPKKVLARADKLRLEMK